MRGEWKDRDLIISSVQERGEREGKSHSRGEGDESSERKREGERERQKWTGREGDQESESVLY